MEWPNSIQVFYLKAHRQTQLLTQSFPVSYPVSPASQLFTQNVQSWLHLKLSQTTFYPMLSTKFPALRSISNSRSATPDQQPSDQPLPTSNFRSATHVNPSSQFFTQNVCQCKLKLLRQQIFITQTFPLSQLKFQAPQAKSKRKLVNVIR